MRVFLSFTVLFWAACLCCTNMASEITNSKTIMEIIVEKSHGKTHLIEEKLLPLMSSLDAQMKLRDVTSILNSQGDTSSGPFCNICQVIFFMLYTILFNQSFLCLVYISKARTDI